MPIVRAIPRSHSYRGVDLDAHISCKRVRDAGRERQTEAVIGLIAVCTVATCMSSPRPSGMRRRLAARTSLLAAASRGGSSRWHPFRASLAGRAGRQQRLPRRAGRADPGRHRPPPGASGADLLAYARERAAGRSRRSSTPTGISITPAAMPRSAPPFPGAEVYASNAIDGALTGFLAAAASDAEASSPPARCRRSGGRGRPRSSRRWTIRQRCGRPGR